MIWFKAIAKYYTVWEIIIRIAAGDHGNISQALCKNIDTMGRTKRLRYLLELKDQLRVNAGVKRILGQELSNKIEAL